SFVQPGWSSIAARATGSTTGSPRKRTKGTGASFAQSSAPSRSATCCERMWNDSFGAGGRARAGEAGTPGHGRARGDGAPARGRARDVWSGAVLGLPSRQGRRPAAPRRAHRDLRPAVRDLGLWAAASGGGSVRGRLLHHRGLLVHVVDLVRQPGGHVGQSGQR